MDTAFQMIAAIDPGDRTRLLYPDAMRLNIAEALFLFSSYSEKLPSKK